MSRPRGADHQALDEGVPIGDRGPGESYRPDNVAPSMCGAHQPGIATPMLDHVAFAALDLASDDRAQLADLLGALTNEADRLMLAQHRAPGEGWPAGGLTVTSGSARASSTSASAWRRSDRSRSPTCRSSRVTT